MTGTGHIPVKLARCLVQGWALDVSRAKLSRSQKWVHDVRVTVVKW